jgi:subtilisin family serine protease
MKIAHLLRVTIFLALLLGAGSVPGLAQESDPRIVARPPQPPIGAIEPAEAPEPGIQQLPQLKAVLIVGPIDGDDGTWTRSEIENMEAAAEELEANGVDVHRFYTPNNDWDAIKQAAEGAHFLLYRGHGVWWPYISDFPHPHVGGFSLKDKFISSDDIRQDLDLAENAIVMLYGCFTAGHSSHEKDHRDIGIDEAKRRVAQYSDPFFDVGASAYYANWFDSAFQMFLRYLFQGQTLGNAYESYFDFNADTVYRTTHPDHPELAMWLDKDKWDGYWQYNNAFAGLPDETLETLFASPALGNVVEDVSFVYSIPERRLLSSDWRVPLDNASTDQPLDWTVSTAGDWFTVFPTSGTTPGGFTISPSTFVTSTPGTYTGAVTVTVTDPPAVEGSPQRIDLKLRVSETSFSYVYLPLVMHAYSAPDSLVHPVEVNDTYFSDQWALPKVDASNAWGLSQGQGTLIAVLDTGVDLDHPDLVSKVRTDVDYDFVNGDENADDDSLEGHGTHVAGIAAAATDNEEGIAGLGWEAEILPLKVMDANGDGNGQVLAEAIYYAADQGADVINMSLGGPYACPSDVQEAANYAYDKDVVLVAASGNTEDSQLLFPANCEHVLGVAATGEGDNLASYSTSGAHVSVAAPGSDIFSTIIPWEYNGDYYYYGTMSGTSMATPHVAGLAALVRSSYPGYTPDQIASSILDNAEDLGPAGWDQDYGCGRIDAFQALAEGAQGDSPVCLEDVGAYATAAKQATAPPTAAPFVPGEIIVTLRDDLSTFQAQSIVGDAEYLPRLEAWRVRVPEGEERERLAELEAEPGVAYAELNYLVFAQ